MSASVLVVGGAGYIGSHMVKALHRSGHRVTTFDNLELGHRDAVLFGELIEGDLRDPASVRRAFTGRHFDVVMHFAAYAYVRESVESPQKYYGNNVVGAIHLLDAMLEHDVRRIVFSSSCATYGESDEPLSEAHPQAPINPYGFTKLIVERMLSDYAAPYRLRSIALRYFNAAGADREGELRERHEPEPHLIPLVLREACRIRDGGDHRAPKLEIYGSDLPTRDGTCVRDYVHVEDICAAHLLACERLLAGEEPLAESYNLGSEAGFSVKEVIEAARAVTGIDIPYRDGSRRAGDPPKLVAASERARKELGWTQSVAELHDIIASAWRSFEAPGS